jgi:hypothetical protein
MYTGWVGPGEPTDKENKVEMIKGSVLGTFPL